MLRMESDKMTEPPIFQPIFSIEDPSFSAYESIFSEPPQNYILSREGLHFQNSFEKLLSAGNNFKLFLKVSLSWMLGEIEMSEGLNFPILKILQKYHVIPSQVYLEIADSVSVREFESFSTAVELFKEVGFKIVLDHIGTTSNHLDRLAAVSPDIIKINIRNFGKMIQTREFLSMIEYLKDISGGLGADLLFNGIEDEDELFLALDTGAKFLQGNLFCEPLEKISIASQSTELLGSYIESFHIKKRKQISKEIHFEASICELLAKQNIHVRYTEKKVLVDVISLFKISPNIMRIYVTDWEGTQVSAYYERNSENGFQENQINLQKNWSYLPFFYKHVKQAYRNPTAWQISDPYWDRELGEKLIVFSKILERQFSIFIDVSITE